MTALKILIAEDYQPSAEILRKFLASKGHEAAITGDGLAALALAERERFDVLLTDCMMPKMNGMELIGQIRRRVSPVPLIVMITALADKESRLAALGAGADDFITKPYSMFDVLRAIDNLTARQAQPVSRDKPEVAGGSGCASPPYPCVFVAASTGGTSAIAELFAAFPVGLPGPILTVLHGPGWMLADFAGQLAKTATIPIVLAAAGMKPEPGKLYLAPGNAHLKVGANFALELADEPPVNHVRPAADVLFKSGVAGFGGHCAGVVLTGMGVDGAAGALAVSRAGGVVIAQDPRESTVAGMPQAVIDQGIADYVLPIKLIPEIVFTKMRRLRDEIKPSAVGG